MSKRKSYNVAGENETELQPMGKGEDEAKFQQVRDTDKVELKRSITLVNGIGIIVGSIIGSGIFLTPSGLYKSTHDPYGALAVWGGCGLFSLVGAICFAELGTCITRSGGDYAYIMDAFGELPAFLTLFVTVIVIRPATAAILALTFAKYAMKPLVDCDIMDQEKAELLLGAVCIGLLTAINCLSVKVSMKIQDIFTVAKLLALTIIIVTGLVYLVLWGQTEEGQMRLDENVFAASGDAEFPSKFTVTGLAIASYNGLFAYAGWNYLNFITAELKDPYRNLPRAIYIGLPLVTGIYVLANAAYFIVLTPAEMINSTVVAAVFGSKTYSKYLQWMMPVFVALSTFGGVNGTLFTTARLFFAGAEEGHMPEVLACVHVRRYTPVPALIFSGAMSVAIMLTGNIGQLLNYVSFILWLSTGFSVGALIVLRYTKPNLERPIRVNLFFPYLYVLLTAVLIAFAVYETPEDSLIGSLITLIGVPVYFLLVWWPRQRGRKSPGGKIRLSAPDNVWTRGIGHVTCFFQKVLCVIPQEKSETLL